MRLLCVFWGLFGKQTDNRGDLRGGIDESYFRCCCSRGKEQLERVGKVVVMSL